MGTRSMLHFLVLMMMLLATTVHPAFTSRQISREGAEEGKSDADLLLNRDERSVVHFPDESQKLKVPTQSGEQASSAWRFQPDDNKLPSIRQSKSQLPVVPLGTSSGMITPVSGTRAVPPGEGVKKGRKAAPDVQDIISGIVHLLGGKVNLHAASGTSEAPPVASGGSSGSTILRPQMLTPHSTRINNRAPPRISEVPFEAIPLELGNSAGKPGQQLPFGVPLRPPVFPPNLPQTGHNVQGMPFTSGIPLPIQLVPPVSPNRPWPPTLPANTPLVGTNSTTEDSTTSSNSTSTTAGVNSATSSTSQSAQVPATSSLPAKSEMTLISFFPEDSSVRHPPAVLATSTTVTPPLPESTTVPAVYETSSLDSILLPSLEDVTVPSSSLIPLDAFSPVPALMAPSVTPSSVTVLPSSSVLQSWPSLSAVPQLEGGVAPTAFYPVSSSYTPPLPAGRPGQVFHDEYVRPNHGYGEVDVITSDNIQPQGTYGDSFELVVTAAQNFGGQEPSPAITTGRPYVIPVDIDQIRGGLQAPPPADTDEYVSIDGRKTYFNLFPTESVGGPEPMVQPTAMPKPPQVNNNNGYGYAYPDRTVEQVRPAPPPRPSYPKPSPPVINRPTPSLIRRPSTTPLSRIDACVVGDPNACLEPNESCQAEEDGSACSCKPGFGRKKASDVCKALTGLLLSIRIDRMDNQRLAWTSNYADSSSPDYQQLEWEANKAINSLMEMTPLSSHFVYSSVNKFYAIGNKIIANASVFMDSSSETQSVTVRPTLQKQLFNVIQQRNNNLGISRLWAEGLTNPIPAVLDLNECGSSDLNDCSPDAECINTQGSFSCQCRPGFSDPYPNDPFQSGRQCNSCTRSYCNNRGDCRIENGKKTCSCQGNYKGATCELDGEVLGVAIGASVAAVIIIVLTLVLLCMWSRRWRQNQEKMVDRSAYMEQLKTMPFPAMMQDRIRWAQYAEAMASAHNLYATPMPPPYAFYQTPSTLQPSPAPPLVHPTLPPPIPPRNKLPVRQTTSLPVALVTSTANQVINNLQELARRLSRKKKPAPTQPDPVNVNPHLALISPAYPVGTMSSVGRASLAPTLPLVGQFRGARSTCGSVLSYGKRSAPPPPPSNPPPALQVMETSEESATESDAPIARPFQVPRPRSRASALSSNNIYFEADLPSSSNDFSNQPQSSMNAYPRPAPRYYGR